MSAHLCRHKRSLEASLSSGVELLPSCRVPNLLKPHPVIRERRERVSGSQLGTAGRTIMPDPR